MKVLLPAEAASEPGRDVPASMALETQVRGIRLAIDFLDRAWQEAGRAKETVGA